MMTESGVGRRLWDVDFRFPQLLTPLPVPVAYQHPPLF